MRYHLTKLRMVIMKKPGNNKCWRETGEREPSFTWWECKLMQPLCRPIWWFFRKLKIELPHDPAIPLLGIYPDKTITWKDACTWMLIRALFAIARTWKKPFIDRWMDKGDVVQRHNWILLSGKKEQSTICSNVDEPGAYLAKWSKSEMEGQISYEITYLQNLK